MAILDFPASPSIDQLYVANGKTWKWNGSSWVAISSSAAKWTNPRNITLNGDLSGQVSIDGSMDVILQATIQPDSVTLGTDTTGNYVAGLTAGTGISVSGTAGEGWLPTVTNTAPNVTTNISITHNASTVVVNSSDGTNGTINAATGSLAGVMTSTDKTKLDSVETNANNYTLPTATTAILGGVRLFNDTAQSVDANTVTTTAARTYGIQLNSSGQAVVNVPWLNTTYAAGNGITLTSTTFSVVGGTGLTQDTGGLSLTAITAGNATVGAVRYNSTTAAAGQFYGGTTVPSGTTRLNYGGYLYATRFYGDGSQLTDITATDSTKLPLAGGTMTGAITFAAGQTWPTFNQNTTGSAATLTTGRTIAMTGDVTYTSASFNGSANVTGTATLANSGVTAGTYTKVTVDAKGRATSGTTLVAADIPNLDAAKITTGSLAVARGGTGVSVQPKFFARSSVDQVISNNTLTKVTLGTEIFDTNNNFASSRFTPTIAGYYQINGCVRVYPGDNTNNAFVLAAIYRNGTDYIRGNELPITIAETPQALVSGVIFFNGTTDYVELYGFVSTNSSSQIAFKYASATLNSYLSGAFLGA
jgi:hypothetical protein